MNIKRTSWNTRTNKFYVHFLRTKILHIDTKLYGFFEPQVLYTYYGAERINPNKRKTIENFYDYVYHDDVESSLNPTIKFRKNVLRLKNKHDCFKEIEALDNGFESMDGINSYLYGQSKLRYQDTQAQRLENYRKHINNNL